jgi:hypothetical protein
MLFPASRPGVNSIWFVVQLYSDGYVQQCSAPPLVVGGRMQMDLQLAARADVGAFPFAARGTSGVFDDTQ